MKTLIALTLSFVLNFAVVAAEAPPEQSPRLFVHLLDYLAIDYPAAIENGKIINEMEYGEMKEFATTLIDLQAQLPEIKDAPGIREQLDTLRDLIHKKATSEEVARAAGDIKWKVIGLTGIPLAPPHWPDLHRGEKVFEDNCASCHGKTGHGDGPSGKGLDPQPSDFHDNSRMEKFTAFGAFNAIRLGVPGTAMAQFSQFSESQVWDLAFYVLSLRHREQGTAASATAGVKQNISLAEVATLSDETLIKKLPGSEAEQKIVLAGLRLRSAEAGATTTFIEVARNELQSSLEDYRASRFDSAKQKSLRAYLNGVEPIEPRLRATAPSLVAEIETRMMAVRTAIDARKTPEEVAEKIDAAVVSLQQCEAALEIKTSPTMTFFISSGIVLREAFEAILLLITLLGVIRSVGSRKAAAYVHSGWMAAVGTGVVFWIFSGWVLSMSGAQRELLEGIVSALAVGIVLYMGFWLHRKTEIGRWRSFIDEMLKTAVDGKRLFLLFIVSYMAVFREAFETVLFLRALMLESGGAHQVALGAGVGVSMVAVLGLGYALLKYSARIPIRQLFDLSAVVMVLLAFMLIGKAIHSFQEAGLVSATELVGGLRIDLLGVYPTYETVLSQLAVLALSLGLWLWGRKPSSLRQQVV